VDAGQEVGAEHVAAGIDFVALGLMIPYVSVAGGRFAGRTDPGVQVEYEIPSSLLRRCPSSDRVHGAYDSTASGQLDEFERCTVFPRLEFSGEEQAPSPARELPVRNFVEPRQLVNRSDGAPETLCNLLSGEEGALSHVATPLRSQGSGHRPSVSPLNSRRKKLRREGFGRGRAPF
jgi:hypothetical protein